MNEVDLKVYDRESVEPTTTRSIFVEIWHRNLVKKAYGCVL